MSIYEFPADSPANLRTMDEVVRAAIAAARRSSCAKDQRGAAVWHNNGGTIIAASNGPPDPFICDGSDACKASCGKVAVHAEVRAVNRYLRLASGLACTGMNVLHIRVVNGQPVTSGPPSCVACSRDMLDAGVAEVWLWHGSEGWSWW